MVWFKVVAFYDMPNDTFPCVVNVLFNGQPKGMLLEAPLSSSPGRLPNPPLFNPILEFEYYLSILGRANEDGVHRSAKSTRVDRLLCMDGSRLIKREYFTRKGMGCVQQLPNQNLSYYTWCLCVDAEEGLF